MGIRNFGQFFRDFQKTFGRNIGLQYVMLFHASLTPRIRVSDFEDFIGANVLSSPQAELTNTIDIGQK